MMHFCDPSGNPQVFLRRSSGSPVALVANLCIALQLPCGDDCPAFLCWPRAAHAASWLAQPHAVSAAGDPSEAGKPLALLLGAAVNQDGRSSSLTAPSGPAQQRLIKHALQAAHLPPHKVQGIPNLNKAPIVSLPVFCR